GEGAALTPAAGTPVVRGARLTVVAMRAVLRGRVGAAGRRVTSIHRAWVAVAAIAGWSARTASRLAAVRGRAGATVVARRAVRLRCAGAGAGLGIAGPGVVTLVCRGAGDRVGAVACALAAGIGPGARVPVVAGSSVRRMPAGARTVADIVRARV